MDFEHVCLSGKTGSDWRTVRTARLTPGATIALAHQTRCDLATTVNLIRQRLSRDKLIEQPLC